MGRPRDAETTDRSGRGRVATDRRLADVESFSDTPKALAETPCTVAWGARGHASANGRARTANPGCTRKAET